MNPFSWFFLGFVVCIFLMATLIVFDSIRSRWMIDRQFILYRILLFNHLSSWLYGDKERDIELFIHNLDACYDILLEYARERRGIYVSGKTLVDEFTDKILRESAEDYQDSFCCSEEKINHQEK